MALPLLTFALRSDRTSLLRIDEATRLQYAQRIYTEGKFRKLANVMDETFNSKLSSEVGELELFLLEQVQKGLPKSAKSSAPDVTNAIIRESNRHGFDPLFVLALIQLESRLNPAARGAHGEIGLMQILPDTAKWLNKSQGLGYTNKKQLLDPEMNIKIGVAYLAMMHEKFNKVHYSVAAYNMGPKNVKRLLARNTKPQIYYQKVVLNYKAIYASLEARAFESKGQTVTVVAVGL
jgi:soluble lytic murein transglycosylase-like protein